MVLTEQPGNGQPVAAIIAGAAENMDMPIPIGKFFHKPFHKNRRSRLLHQVNGSDGFVLDGVFIQLPYLVVANIFMGVKIGNTLPP